MPSARAIGLLVVCSFFTTTLVAAAPSSTRAAATQFGLTLEWEWTGESSPEPQSNSVHSMPVVADLDLDGLPEIIFHTSFGENYGILRIIAGYLGGAHIRSYTDDLDLFTYPNGNIAVGNIDDDEFLEIVAPRHGGHGLVAFDHDLTPIWSTESDLLVGWGGPCIANLDCAGPPEIIVGNAVFDNLGNLIWQGTSGRGSNQDMGGAGVDGPLSCVADLDMDGFPEIVAGNAAYHYWPEDIRGIYWDRSGQFLDGFPAIANFDDDEYPEIAVVSGGAVRLMQHTGEMIWEVAIPGSPWPWGAGGICGSPPLVADVNSDGELEIGTSGRYRYSVIAQEGSGGAVMWGYDIFDPSSSSAGSAGFDFDGDGDVEIVYADEVNLRVFDFDGSNGMLIGSWENTSGTWLEIPVIADVDTDCVAEIVIASDNGIRAFGTSGEEWPSTRQIWNQHTYHVTNVNDNGSIPQQESDSWTANNDYRSQEFCVDLLPPEITCPPVTLLSAGSGCAATYEGPPATATDDCDGAPKVTSSPPLPVTFDDLGTYVITWTATDCKGRTSSCDQEISVVDTDPPEMSCPPDTGLEADRHCQVTYEGASATATDNCDPNPLVTSVPPLPATFTGAGGHEIVYTAIDQSGNVSTCTQVVTAIDVTPPEIACPPDTSLEADRHCQAVYEGPSATPTDNCDSNPLVTSVPPLPATFAGAGNHEIEYTATDSTGNTSKCSQIVTVIDVTPPEIACPPDTNLEVDLNCEANYAGPPATATDNCDPNPLVTSVPPLPVTFAGTGHHEIVYTAIDQSGNVSTCTQVIAVVDMTPPEIDCPPDVVLGAGPNCQVVYEGPSAAATDNCDPNPLVTSMPPLPATFTGAGGHEIVYTAIDQSGNVSTCTQVIAVVDTTRPEIACPPDISLEADRHCQVVYEGPSAAATDNCDPNPLVTSVPALPATFTGTGNHEIEYTATDSTGNTSKCSQIVTVIDATPPEIACPPDTNLEADLNCEANYAGPPATATDNCDPNPLVTSVPPLPVTFAGAGGHEIVYTAIDQSGNVSTCTQVIAVLDMTPPEIDCPPDVVLGAGPNCQVVYEGPSAAATDNCDPNPLVTSVPALPATFTGAGNHEIEYTATDSAGNASTCTQVITVVDVTPPDIVCPPDTNIEADRHCQATYEGPSAAATDNCDPSPFVSSIPPLPVTFTGPGDHEIVYVAVDQSGNVSTCTQVITVVDITPPEIVCPPDSAIEPVDFDCSITYAGPPATSNDNCDPAPLVTSEPPLPATFPNTGIHTIVFTATDYSGNASLCTMTVTILPTSFCLKQDAVSFLTALKPTGENHLDMEIDKAIWHIEKSLDANLWSDVKRLGCKHGQKVFNEEETAVVLLVSEMNKKKFPPGLIDDFKDAISMLLDADDILAQTELDDAARSGGDKKHIEKAKAELSEARKRRAQDDYIHAIDHFRKSWDEACKALQRPYGNGEQVAAAGERTLEVRLVQNSPNPFSNNTTISFTLPLAGHVRLEVYDTSGRRVATLVDEDLEQGIHTVEWYSTDAGSGIYFCKLLTDNGSSIRKMILLR
jgi:hypothetical protein